MTIKEKCFKNRMPPRVNVKHIINYVQIEYKQDAFEKITSSASCSKLSKLTSSSPSGLVIRLLQSPVVF